MNLQKLFFPVILSAVVLTACTSEVTLPSESLSTSIKSYVVNNYPDVTIDDIVVNGNTAIVTLSSGEELNFDTNGVLISYSNSARYGISADSLYVSNDSIPVENDSIDGHHGKGHHGNGHHGNGGHGNGNHGNGNQGDLHHGNGHHGNHGGGPGHKPHENDLIVDSLPTIINDYIVANYAGYSVIHAGIDTICSGAVINVMVCDSLSEPVKLVFDVAGNFVMKGKRILYSSVPTEISAAVSAGYSTYAVSKRCSEYVLADNSVQYKIYLKLEKEHIWILLKADGTMVCQK